MTGVEFSSGFEQFLHRSGRNPTVSLQRLAEGREGCVLISKTFVTSIDVCSGFDEQPNFLGNRIGRESKMKWSYSVFVRLAWIRPGFDQQLCRVNR